MLFGLAAAGTGAALAADLPPLPVQVSNAVAAPPAAQTPIATPPPAATDFNKPELPISLKDGLEKAFESNLDLSIDRISPLEAQANVLAAKGAFDPVFNASYNHGVAGTPEFTNPPFVVNDYDSASASINQPITTGGTIGVTTSSTSTSNTGNDFVTEWDSFAGLTLSQPLLQNFGTDVSQAAIRVAQRNQSATEAALEYEIDQIITNVANAYYELVFARSNYQALKESVRLAEQLKSDNQARVEIGTMSPLDISTANAEVASRRENLLSAARLIENDENNLRLLITKDVTPLLKHRLVPVDLPPENWTPDPLQADIAGALQARADLRQARELLAQNKLTEAYRKNQLLPTLGVTGAYGYEGLGYNATSSYQNVSGAHQPDWSVGVVLQIPIGNRSERGQYQAAQYETTRQQLILRQLEQNVIVQTDNAEGQAETNRQQITAARVARQLAEESLRAEEEKLKAGVSTSYVVLQLQDNLRTARITELRAIADFQESVVELMRVEGRARSYFNIELRGAAY